MGVLEIGQFALTRFDKMPEQADTWVDIPPTEQLIVQGGDERITPDPFTGNNRYGCGAVPDSSQMAFGSSTASTISSHGFAAAESLRRRIFHSLGSGSQARIYERELGRIHGELLRLCGLSNHQGLEVVFAPSGTDIHLIASKLAGADETRLPLAIMVDAAETGSGVGSALAGRHVNGPSTREGKSSQNAFLPGSGAVEVVAVPVREADGTPRNADDVDAEIADLVARTVAQGRKVLLTLVDVSKTGLIAPSPACAMALRRKFPDRVDVLVDACQFRLSPNTLKAYLGQGFMVALTGSKFVTGPSFSGALLIPSTIAGKYQRRLFPRTLRSHSARGEWPKHWPASWFLEDKANFGLLLRWEAALAELRAFRSVQESDVRGFLQDFGDAVSNRLINDPAFEPLPVAEINRQSLVNGQSWDQLQTIFPFMLYGRDTQGRKLLDRTETAQVHKWLQEDLTGVGFDGLANDLASLHCQVGQPVACGHRQGKAVSALRLCASARLVVDAVSGGNASAIIADAMATLDKAAALASLA